MLVLPPLPRLCTLVPGPLETSLCALELLVLPCIILRISWPLAPPETRNGGYTENAEGLLLAQPLVVRSRSCACMSSVSSTATLSSSSCSLILLCFSAVYGSKSRNWNWKAARKALEITFTTQKQLLEISFFYLPQDSKGRKTCGAPAKFGPPAAVGGQGIRPSAIEIIFETLRSSLQPINRFITTS